MRKNNLDGREVSVIALGSGHFGGKCEESLARELMDAYVSLGGDFLDTARVYGDFVTPRNGESEKVIGRWLSDRHARERIFLSTKGGHPPLSDMQRSRLSREEIRSDLQESLSDLQTDHVDIFWLHRDDESRPVGEIMDTLQELIDEGWTDRVGVSNWRTVRIIEAEKYAAEHGMRGLSGNQPQFSLAYTVNQADSTLVSMDAEMWRMHRETGLPCCCFSSQAQAFFTRLDQLGVDGLPEAVKWSYLSDENLAIYDRLKALRERKGISTGAAALTWLTSQPFPCFALVGASRVEHVLSLKEACDAVLTDGERDALRVN